MAVNCVVNSGGNQCPDVVQKRVGGHSGRWLVCSVARKDSQFR